MAKSKGQKFYAVSKGRVPGIYNTWAECEAQVKGFGGATFKSFKTRQEAESFVTVHASSPSALAGHQSSSQQTSASTANNTSGNNVRNGTNEFPTGENSRESPMSKQGDIYIDPQCQSISNYNTNHPREVELDKTKRTEGHIGPGLVSRVYAVAIGRRVGVYSNWKDCEAQIKGYTRASFKAFYTLEDAVQFIHSNDSNVRGKKRPLETNGETTSNKRVHEESDEKFDLDITIYFDGGSRSNPGVAGAGAEVKIQSKDKLTTYHIREYCGDKQTNNFAEYTGLIVGLKLAHQRICDHTNSVDRPKHPSWRPSYRVRAFGDSNLIIQQMKGSWQCKNANIKALYTEAVHCYGKIMSQIGPKGTVEFEHVYREDNKMADELANEAMDQKRSWITSLDDCVDIKPPAANKKEVIEFDGSDDGSVISC